MELPSDAHETLTYNDLSSVVRTARRGFRSDVAQLAAALPGGALLVALAKTLADVPVGESVQPQDGEVSLVPHLLPEQDGALFVPLFTDPDVLKTVGQYLEWGTEGDTELQYCTLPAPVALDLALQLIDGTRVVGAVINPSDDYELLLNRDELGALATGSAIPLVGYVQQIPLDKNEASLVAQSDQPPSTELLQAIRDCLAHFPDVLDFELRHTFNPERDLEPHPTLVLKVGPEVTIDPDELNERLGTFVEGKLPEPGYIDVLFDTDEPSLLTQK